MATTFSPNFGVECAITLPRLEFVGNRGYFELRNLVLIQNPVMIAKIAYFAHDLSDPVVHRRIRMLVSGGAVVTPIGFRRSAGAPSTVEGLRLIDLGRTADGMLAKRALLVAGAVAKLDDLAEHVREANVILARNLEMLVLAIRARKRFAPRATVVYECLDIHRMLLSSRLDGTLLRLLESRLWRDVDLLLTSSPAFIRNYFTPRGFLSPIRLVENKVLMIEERDERRTVRPPPGPPWRIGWFGVIRCKQSLELLSSLARTAKGVLEVVIRGRPSDATFPDFNAAIANRPHIRYAGTYSSPADLGRIYGEVHFSWAIDYYERGQNSSWLLPNRIYEGSLYGTVPIGLAGVETGQWLAERGPASCSTSPSSHSSSISSSRLDQNRYLKLVSAVEALPRTDLVSDRDDCRELVEALCAS